MSHVKFTFDLSCDQPEYLFLSCSYFVRNYINPKKTSFFSSYLDRRGGGGGGVNHFWKRIMKKQIILSFRENTLPTAVSDVNKVEVSTLLNRNIDVNYK